MKFVQSIGTRFPSGLFIAAATAVLGRLKQLSLGRAVARSLSKDLGPAPGKLQAWLGDAYIMLWLCMSFLLVFLLATWSLPGWLQLMFALAVGYRLLELGAFALGWILVDAGPLHSYRRSILDSRSTSSKLQCLPTILDGVSRCGRGASFPGWWSHFPLRSLSMVTMFCPATAFAGWFRWCASASVWS